MAEAAAGAVASVEGFAAFVPAGYSCDTILPYAPEHLHCVNQTAFVSIITDTESSS